MATVHQDRRDGQSTLTRTLSRLQPGVDRVLQERPYHPWHLLPLAAYLCESEWDYTDSARRVIIDALEQGATLEMLVREGWLEPSDLAEARRLLRSGRRWYRLYLASRAAAEASERSIEQAERERIEREYPIGSADSFQFSVPSVQSVTRASTENRTLNTENSSGASPIPPDAAIVPPELALLDELLGEPYAFPPEKSPADRRADRADVAEFYRP